MHKLIENSEQDGKRTSPEEIERQKEDIRRVVQYCQNQVDCRRAQVLGFFGETFDRKLCNKNCDNCGKNVNAATEDVSRAASDAITLVGDLVATGNVTLNHCADVFRGAKTKPIRERGHDQLAFAGKGSNMIREQVERLFEHLVAQGALREVHIQNRSGWSNSYIQVWFFQSFPQIDSLPAVCSWDQMPRNS
jgi:superfamily II DNA helicase RecQ